MHRYFHFPPRARDLRPHAAGIHKGKLALPLIMAGAWLFSIAQIQAQMKIGTVDVNRVIKEYSKTKEAEKKVNEAKDAAKKEYDERVEAYKKALEQINKINTQLDAPALSAEAKTSKTRERDDKIANIKNMEREVNEFRQTREDQLQQQMLRMREGILKDITDAVLERVKANGMELVFDKSGASLNRFSPVLFSPDSADFTAEVISALAKKERAGSTAPTPAQP